MPPWRDIWTGERRYLGDRSDFRVDAAGGRRAWANGAGGAAFSVRLPVIG